MKLKSLSFKSFFNLRTTILKFDKSNKKAVSELTITAGSSSGLKKGNELIVKQIEEVEGFEVETEVGVLKVTEPGARTSKCKVSKVVKKSYSCLIKITENLLFVN